LFIGFCVLIFFAAIYVIGAVVVNTITEHADNAWGLMIWVGLYGAIATIPCTVLALVIHLLAKSV
jgi:hypothetical protein